MMIKARFHSKTIYVDTKSIECRHHHDIFVRYYDTPDMSRSGDYIPLQFLKFDVADTTMIPVKFKENLGIFYTVDKLYLDFTSIRYDGYVKGVVANVYCSKERENKFYFKMMISLFEECEEEEYNMVPVKFTEEFCELTNTTRDILYLDSNKLEGASVAKLYFDKDKVGVFGTVSVESFTVVEEDSEQEENVELHTVDGVDYILRRREDNSSIIEYLTNAAAALSNAKDNVQYECFTNLELYKNLAGMQETIGDIIHKINSGLLVIEEPVPVTKYYYRLDYFFNRKHNGSLYLACNKPASDFIDDDAFLEYLSKSNDLEEYIDAICNVIRISKETYEANIK